MKRLFAGVFGGFCIMIIAIGFFNNYHFSRIHRLQKTLVKIEQLSQQLQEHKEQFRAFGQHNSLFDSVANDYPVWRFRNEQFWKKTDTSYEQLIAAIENEQLPAFLAIPSRRALTHISKKETRILKLAGNIGFKEMGSIGRMRKAAHIIEAEGKSQETRLLSIRRHEKDFLMRVDPHYASLLNAELNQWISAKNTPGELAVYGQNFNAITRSYLALLQAGGAGVYNRWNEQFEQMQLFIRKERSILLMASFNASANARSINLLFNISVVVLAIFFAVFFTRRFTRQVTDLQRAMAKYISAGYHYDQVPGLRMPGNEFGKITLHFLQLTRKIRNDVQLLEDRVARRTTSLEQKNNQLEQQHREIMDSLRYAQDLQQSLLVSRSKMLGSFQEAWIHYQPKNLVGGDFFWMKEIEIDNQQVTYFALADCTGHGVPGALLSVMGMNTLDELLQKGTTSPATLLNELRTLISRRLNTHEDKRYDGMDIALFSLNHVTNELVFAGAQMPLWIVRNTTLTEIHGQRMPVGYTYFDVIPFREERHLLHTGDRLVLFSDGIIDQFGGPKGKKLGRKALRELLTIHGNQPVPLFFSRLVQHIDYWKGSEEQTDDCTLLVLEPKSIQLKEVEIAEVANVQTIELLN